MASGNKSTGLQIALVFAVMSTIIALVIAFLQYRAVGESEARLKTASDGRTQAEGGLRTAIGNVDNLKAMIGFANATEIGKPEEESGTSVIGQTKKLIAESAPGGPANSTVKDTVLRLASELNNVQQEKSALNAKALQLQATIASLQSEYQAKVDEHDKAQKRAENERQLAQASKEKAVADKDKELVERQSKIQELQAGVQSLQQQLAAVQQQSQGHIARLEEINRGLRGEKENLVKTTFEVPSGAVQYVDPDTKLVWINRGEADMLRKGTTFSVYKQVNKGVARGSQDIKGSIEVTQIIGPHQSEARITRSENNDPIIPGDPIYTPLWKAGQKQRFALVGLIDLDNDGVSDREILHEIVTAAGGEIVDEVDDKGIRHPTNGNINVGTKFLVIGKIPDFTQSKPDEQEAHKKIGKLQHDMRAEAAEHGVRVVSLGDFLSYIGYEPGRRVWRPGTTDRWNLHSGSEGTIERPDRIARPQSGGVTSGLYNGTTRPMPESTTGSSRKVPTK